MTQNFKHFRNRVELYTYLAQVATGFDAVSSARMVPFCFVVGGETYREGNFRDFLKKVNVLCGTNFDETKSINRSGIFLLAEHSEKQPEASIEVEEVSEVAEVVVPEETPSPAVEDPQQVDIIAAAQELYDESDKKGSKERLESFAKEHGVALDKRGKFESMIEEFKNQIGN